MSEPAIVATGLVKYFGATCAVDGVDLQVAQGQVLGLLGPNGAGKTTTVRMLATLSAPEAGQAKVGGYYIVRQAHTVEGGHPAGCLCIGAAWLNSARKRCPKEI